MTIQELTISDLLAIKTYLLQKVNDLCDSMDSANTVQKAIERRSEIDIKVAEKDMYAGQILLINLELEKRLSVIFK